MSTRPREPAVQPALDIASYGRGAVAGADGATVLMFDVALRVTFVEGDDLRGFGFVGQPLLGRVLADVLSLESWANLEEPFVNALAGLTSTVEVSYGGRIHSIHVSPLVSGPAITGALSVERRVQWRAGPLHTAAVAGLSASRLLLSTAFTHAPIGMSVVDLEGRWLRVNAAYCRMLGYEEEELIDKTFRDLTHPDDLEEDLEWTRRAAAGETKTLDREKRYIARDGTTVWVHARAELVDDDSGPAYIVSMLEDITARRSAALALQTSERRLSAILDHTPNAVSVQDRDYRFQFVNRAFEQRFGRTRDLVVGQLDDDVLPAGSFSVDRESHDRVLRTGEPVEMDEVTSEKGETGVYRTLTFPLRDEGHHIYAVCRIGSDVTDAKRREQELRDRLEWTDRIHSAIAQKRLVLYAQPIIDLGTREVEQAELLVRMLERQGSTSLIAPGEFLPAAEHFGLIGAIDLWVVSEATELAKTRSVEVNLSGLSISDAGLVTEIERLVISSGAPPQNIVFEITETAAVLNMKSAREFAERLRDLGCRFALDDFGVGFGTLTYLKHLPVDYLKIDIEFVRDITRADADRQVVRAVVGMARDFGIKTIAEGVEDEETLELLARLDVDYAQGYWIGRPAPIPDYVTGTTDWKLRT